MSAAVGCRKISAGKSASVIVPENSQIFSGHDHDNVLLFADSWIVTLNETKSLKKNYKILHFVRNDKVYRPNRDFYLFYEVCEYFGCRSVSEIHGGDKIRKNERKSNEYHTSGRCLFPRTDCIEGALQIYLIIHSAFIFRGFAETPL